MLSLHWLEFGVFTSHYQANPSKENQLFGISFVCLRMIKWFRPKIFALAPANSFSSVFFGQFLFVGRNGKMLVTIRGYLTLINESVLSIRLGLILNLVFKAATGVAIINAEKINLKYE